MSDYKERIETLNENDYVQVSACADCVELRLGEDCIIGALEEAIRFDNFNEIEISNENS